MRTGSHAANSVPQNPLALRRTKRVKTRQEVPRLWQIEERTCRYGIVGTVRLPGIGRVQQVHRARQCEQSATQRGFQVRVADFAEPVRRDVVRRAFRVLAGDGHMDSCLQIVAPRPNLPR